jgi:uncharacterized protein YndB with AHSA1/START domain
MHVESTLDPPVLVMRRAFAAPRDLVFKAWTEPERLKRWFGPQGWELTFCELDLRPGGEWRYCMSGPDGAESWGKAVYREIQAPDRLVYTDTFTDPQGNVLDGMPTTLVSIDFDGATEVLNRTQFATVDDLNAVLSMGVEEGMRQTFERLDALLAEGDR